jgi:hypothetical protein
MVISFWVAFRVSLFLYTLARLNTYLSIDLDNPDTLIIFVVQAIEGVCFVLWGILLYRMVRPQIIVYKQLAWWDKALCIIFPSIWLFVLQ